MRSLAWRADGARRSTSAHARRWPPPTERWAMSAEAWVDGEVGVGPLLEPRRHQFATVKNAGVLL
jgi:hypothetical protein